MSFGKATLSLVVLVMIASCKGNSQQTGNVSEVDKVQVGAESPEMYYPLIRDKRVAVVANQTSMIGSVHLVDSLVHAGMTIKKVFGPEHGFRGNAADGEKVESGFDLKTGIPVVSLYGSHKKPTPEDLADVDIVIFDIQDVGARFYTYISTMSYVMEACAENGMRLIVLDRPNPHGDYVDGPVLEKEYSSFVGLHPVPVVHGMTIGEYARLVNGEGWLKDGIQCDLKVIPCKNYDHLSRYELPVAPSPNLPNNNAIQLYPSLCFFEGTIISIGRGTDYPFQVIGHPDLAIGSFVFTPQSIPGVSEHPPFEGKTCYGQSLIGFIQSVLSKERRLHLNWIISYYSYFKGREAFFTPYFTKLAGTDKLEQQIKEELSEEQIRATWQEDLKKFKIIRKKYLLYPDFE